MLDSWIWILLLLLVVGVLLFVFMYTLNRKPSGTNPSPVPFTPTVATFNGGELPYSEIITNSEFQFAANTDVVQHPGSLISSIEKFGKSGENFTLAFTAPEVTTTSPTSQTFPPNVDGFYVSCNSENFSSVGVRMYTNTLEYVVDNGVDPTYIVTHAYTSGQEIKITFNGTLGETKLFINKVLQDTSSLLGQDSYGVNFKAQAILSSITVSNVIFTNDLL